MGKNVIFSAGGQLASSRNFNQCIFLSANDHLAEWVFLQISIQREVSRIFFVGRGCFQVILVVLCQCVVFSLPFSVHITTSFIVGAYMWVLLVFYVFTIMFLVLNTELPPSNTYVYFFLYTDVQLTR